MRPTLHIKKGDFVHVMAGRDRGKTGRVLRVYPNDGFALVEKINVVKRHSRPTQKNPQGGILDKEMPLPASRLQLVCMHCRRPTRLKRKLLPSGDKVRVCRHCNEQLDRA